MRSGRARWVWLASLAAIVAGGLTTALVVAPSLALSRAQREAAARGIQIGAARSRIQWFAVSFEDVDVRLVGVSGIQASFAELRVSVDRWLHPVELGARGGRLVVQDDGDLQTQLEAWRGHRPVSASSGQRRLGVTVELDSVNFSSGERRAALTQVILRRDGDDTVVGFSELRADSGAATLGASGGQLRLGLAPLTLREAHVATAELGWTAPQDPGVTLDHSPPVVIDPPPPDIALLGRVRKHAIPTPPSTVDPPPSLLPDLHRLRADVAAVISLNATKIPQGSVIQVDALSFRLQRGSEQLSLGSGPFSVERDAERIALTFSTSPSARSTPLAVHAELPLGSGDVELSVSGGPVPLSLLGIRDGGLLHLMNVDRATVGGKGRVVLDAAGHSLTFDVEAGVHALSLREPRLAREPVVGLDLGVRARGLIDDKGELRLDDAEGSLGGAHATVHGGLVQTPDYLTATFEVDVPTASCQALLTSVPTALLPTLSGARMDGTFGVQGKLAVDSRNLDKLVLHYDVSDRCRLVDVPSDLDKGRFAKSFTHAVYTPDGDIAEETTGPGTPTWTDLEDISPFMQVAVLTTEDGAFFRHHGFNHAAIRNAIIANLKARRFVRGASTITMQLAKNLFLTREKTLGRKLEELILADYLEQEFTKNEMMELYLNVIEFGPNLYGITAAAQHYFGRPPSELNLAECLFLSSILPAPVAFHKVYDKGELSEAWMRTIRARMEIAQQTGEISAAELAEGLTEPVIFHHEKDPPPPPRPPITTRIRPGDATDWQELN